MGGVKLIRDATEDDLDAIADMAKEFWDYTAFDDPFDYETIYERLYICLDQNMLAVSEIDGNLAGFVAGVTDTLLANKNVKVGIELAWWVNPSYRGGSAGIKLLQYIEKLAREQGVKYWHMVYMNSSMPETVKNIYERLGYKKTEAVYLKRL